MAARMRIRVKKEAKRRFRQILLEGKKLFGVRVTNRLYETYIHDLELLSQNPLMGQIEPILLNEPFVYRALPIHGHYKLIYRIDKDIIYVVDIWDTRREPKKLADELND